MNKLETIDQHAKLLRLSGLLAYGYTVALMEFKRRHPEGPRPMLDTTQRDNAEQDRLYEQGRSTPGPIVTYKRGGEGKHNKFPSQAFDVKMVWPDGKIDWGEKWFIEFEQCMGLSGVKYTWGGTFNTLRDLPHFEL